MTNAEPRPNPYQPPVAPVAKATDLSGVVVPGGRRCPAGAGLTWIGQGWRQFTSAPLPWIGVTLGFFVVLIVVSLIPVLSVVTWLLQVVLSGGIYMGCRAIDRGQPFAAHYLGAGFSDRLGRLAAVGALLMVLNVVFALVLGVVAVGLFGFSLMPDFSNLSSHWDVLQGALGVIAGLAVLALLYVTLAGMLGLFSPVLVAVYDQPAVESLKSSFVGCWRNMLSLTVLGIALLVLGLIAVVPLGLGLLIYMPVAWAAIYCAARDIFEV